MSEIHKMNWRNAKKEWPEEGSVVAMLYQHNKRHVPMSCEIMFGIVSYANDGSGYAAFSDDFSGHGSWGVHFGKGCCDYDDEPLAWMPAKEFPIPDWVEHDKWWGPDERNP